jgi:hypothetical protein
MKELVKKNNADRRKEFNRIYLAAKARYPKVHGAKSISNELKRKCRASILITYLIVIERHHQYTPSNAVYAARLISHINKFWSIIKGNEILTEQMNSVFKVFDATELHIFSDEKAKSVKYRSSRAGEIVSFYTHDAVKKIYAGESSLKECINFSEDLEDFLNKGIFEYIFEDITQYLVNRFSLVVFMDPKSEVSKTFEFASAMKYNNRVCNERKGFGNNSFLEKTHSHFEKATNKEKKPAKKRKSAV